MTTFSDVKIVYMDKISENIDWNIAYWYIQGLSTTEIGKKVGMHRSSVYRRLQTNSVQAIVNSFRNEMFQNLFAGMLGLGREIISSFHQKVKDNKVEDVTKGNNVAPRKFIIHIKQIFRSSNTYDMLLFLSLHHSYQIT